VQEEHGVETGVRQSSSISQGEEGAGREEAARQHVKSEREKLGFVRCTILNYVGELQE
jgi:hypothetical protein